MYIIEFYSYPNVTFSTPCPSCQRHIQCDTSYSAEGRCACGADFVLKPVETEDWSKPQGPRCMDCGTTFGPSEPDERRNPWSGRGPHQWQCAQCEIAEAKRRH